MSISTLENMPVHGGQIHQVMQSFPEAPRPYVDLSTGISPYAYPLDTLDLSGWTRLPEAGEELSLRQTASRAYGVPIPDMVVAGPGTQMLIALLPQVLNVRTVTIFGPTYSGHETAWRNAGADVDVVMDLAAFEFALAESSGRACILCNPNNPDGRYFPIQTLERFAKCCAAAGNVLIVDEAFADFEPDSAVSLLPAKGLIILRSFGKSYGLPGLRLGFLISSDEVTNRMQALMGDWAVSVPAITAGCQALADQTWLKSIGRQLEIDSLRLRTILGKGGLDIVGHTRLFCLAGTLYALDLWKFLCARGILTRAFLQRPTELRFGSPRNETEWQRLESALLEWNDLFR